MSNKYLEKIADWNTQHKTRGGQNLMTGNEIKNHVIRPAESYSRIAQYGPEETKINAMHNFDMASKDAARQGSMREYRIRQAKGLEDLGKRRALKGKVGVALGAGAALGAAALAMKNKKKD